MTIAICWAIRLCPRRPRSSTRRRVTSRTQAPRSSPSRFIAANQPYDTTYNYLLQPVTSGEGGFWTSFDWNSSFELAQEKTGLDYSGNYGFARTDMYWPVTHMVQPKANALQCDDCHTAGGRMDWEALGYPGDPIEWGGRFDDQPTASR